MESDTFLWRFHGKLVWRLSGNLLCYVFFIKTPDKIHNFYKVATF